MLLYSSYSSSFSATATLKRQNIQLSFSSYEEDISILLKAPDKVTEATSLMTSDSLTLTNRTAFGHKG